MLEWSPGHMYQIWCRLYEKCLFYEYFSTEEVAWLNNSRWPKTWYRGIPQVIYTKFGEDQMRIKYFLSILVFERLRDSILLDGLKLMLEWSPGHIYQIWCRLYGKCVFYEYFSAGEVAWLKNSKWPQTWYQGSHQVIYTKFGEDQMRIKYYMSISIFERLRDSIISYDHKIYVRGVHRPYIPNLVKIMQKMCIS